MLMTPGKIGGVGDGENIGEPPRGPVPAGAGFDPIPEAVGVLRAPSFGLTDFERAGAAANEKKLRGARSKKTGGIKNVAEATDGIEDRIPLNVRSGGRIGGDGRGVVDPIRGLYKGAQSSERALCGTCVEKAGLIPRISCGGVTNRHELFIQGAGFSGATQEVVPAEAAGQG